MAYASLQDAIDLYGEEYVLLSTDRSNSGKPNATVFTKASNNASNHVDSYLGVRYAVPVTPVPDVLKQRTVDIAIYLASIDGGVLTEEKRKRYEDADKWLKDVAAGKATLGMSEAEPIEEDLPQIVESTSTERLFTRASMRRLL